MSRSYSEEWERRKSYLIRSLFHEFPNRVLSPVPEESTQSSYAPVDETSTQSSVTQPPLSSELDASSASEAPGTQVTATHARSSVERPYSPLPPLIIERAPNKHDEPPEFYRELLIRISKIYQRMFVEDRDIYEYDFSEDVIETESIVSDVLNDSSLSIKERHFSFSDGYSADLESIMSEVRNDDEFIDEDNSTNVMQAYKSRASINEGNVAHDAACCDFQESSVSNCEPDYRQITAHAIVHSDGVPLADVTPSPVYDSLLEEESAHVGTGSSTVGNIPAPSENQAKLQVALTYLCEDRQGYYSPVLQNTSGERTHADLQYTQWVEGLNTHVIPSAVGESSPLEPTDLKHIDCAMEVQLSEENIVCEELLKSPILLGLGRQDLADPVQTSLGQGRIETLLECETNLEEIATRAVALTVCSPQTLMNEKLEWTLAGDREAAIIEHHQDLTTTSSTKERETSSNEYIDLMRAAQCETQRESFAVDTRLTSDMDLTCECNPNTAMQDVSNDKSPSQDGRHVKETANPDTSSCAIDDVLISIFNNSYDKYSDNRKNRKRCYTEMSMQTENVLWNDVKDIFFVGTPKILRLCCCDNHVCEG